MGIQVKVTSCVVLSYSVQEGFGVFEIILFFTIRRYKKYLQSTQWHCVLYIPPVLLGTCWLLASNSAHPSTE